MISEVKERKVYHMYKIINDISPVYLNSGITMANQTHNYNTRFATDKISLKVPKSGRQSRFTFIETGINEWNRLPSTVQNATSIYTLKKHSKAYYNEILKTRDHIT